jgi:hypothetical protein
MVASLGMLTASGGGGACSGGAPVVDVEMLSDAPVDGVVAIAVFWPVAGAGAPAGTTTGAGAAVCANALALANTTPTTNELE